MNLFSQAIPSAESVALLRNLITLRLGLQMRAADEASLQLKLQQRMKALRISQGEQYYQLLTSWSEPSHREWQELAIALTIPETYFFRDRGQFKILREVILPDLIQQRAASRSLKIWSAGCSTGEEAYSLAILLSELLPSPEDWKITILGTDLNPNSIQKARQAIYSSWSFRQVDPQIQTRYFQPLPQGWQLKTEFRQAVSFQVLNLVFDEFPTSQWQEVDLIICRNVFVYFEKLAIAQVVQKFYQTLQAGGYLLTAHSELQGIAIAPFQTKVFPESVIYQKLNVGQSSRLPDIPPLPPIPLPSPLPPIKTPPFTQSIPLEKPTQSPLETTLNQKLSQAQTLASQKKYPDALETLQEILKQQSQHFSGQLLAAEIHANLGNYDQAIQYCQNCLQIDDLSVAPYRLMAQISEEKNDLESAKLLWKKIIYLEPKEIGAYLALASLYDQSQEPKRAKKLRLVAWEILQGIPAEQIIPGQTPITAQELSQQLKKLLI